jgi:hypothetical protein
LYDIPVLMYTVENQCIRCTFEVALRDLHQGFEIQGVRDFTPVCKSIHPAAAGQRVY